MQSAAGMTAVGVIRLIHTGGTVESSVVRSGAYPEHCCPPPHPPTGLDVSHNVLGALPDSLSGLQGLTRLDCSHNHLTSFPQVSAHTLLVGLLVCCCL